MNASYLALLFNRHLISLHTRFSLATIHKGIHTSKKREKKGGKNFSFLSSISRGKESRSTCACVCMYVVLVVVEVV